MSLRARCSDWVAKTFGEASLMDLKNRAARVMEEGVELAQCEGVTREEAIKIVERAYSRPVGKPAQELAGVQFTLFAYSRAAGFDPLFECELELRRVEGMDPEHFRAKQREKFAAGTDFVEPK